MGSLRGWILTWRVVKNFKSDEKDEPNDINRSVLNFEAF